MQDRGAGRGTSYRRTPSRRATAAADEVPQDEPPRCTFYSVGLCDQDLKAGGWATVGTIEGAAHEESGEERGTTVLRMELTAALRSLAATQPGSHVAVYTYGQTIPHAMRSQIKKWRSAGWRTQAGQPVPHQDMWMALWDSAAERQVQWGWQRVRNGGAGNTNSSSRRALDLAQAAKRRAASSQAPAPAVGEVAAPTASSLPATRCPQCGRANRPQSRFCAFCGHAQAHPWLTVLPHPTPIAQGRRSVPAPENGEERSTVTPARVDDGHPVTIRRANRHSPPSTREETVAPEVDGPRAATESRSVPTTTLRTDGGLSLPVSVAESAMRSTAEETRRALLAECQALEVRWAALHDAIGGLDSQRQQLVAAIAGRLGDTSGHHTASWTEGMQLFLALGAHAAQLAHLAEEAGHVGDQYSNALHRMLTDLAPEPDRPALPNTRPIPRTE